ncbi:glycosyltransferase family 2 protein [candidate division WWE3 bacterium]|nr:glycosyltransferase family 2 protein [candidate division WWE3 bacterium]
MTIMLEMSVVVPAYNEKANIGISLTRILTFLNDFEPSYEILVVDDGSTDNTSEIVENYSKTNEKIRLIKNTHRGKGYAVRTGFQQARGRYVLLSDADSATPIEELKRLMVWIKDNGFDLAIGSREGIGAVRKNEPVVRHVMGKIFNFLIRLILLPGIKDTQCGFKLFKSDAAQRIFEKSLLYPDSSRELRVPKVTAFDVEILFIARRLGYKIKEVPVVWEYGKNTKVNKLRDAVYNFLDVIKVKLNDMKGLYS